MHASPAVCPCCNGTNFRKLGEDIDRDAGARPGAMEGDPACPRTPCLPDMRDHRADAGAVASDRARPGRTAAPGRRPVRQVRAHLPLNRQSEIYANEGVDLDVSTLADWVGACAATLKPLVDADPKRTCSPPSASMPRHHGAGAGQGQSARPDGCGPTCAMTAVRRAEPHPAALFHYSPDARR